MNFIRTTDPRFLALTMLVGAITAMTPACGSETISTGPGSSRTGSYSSSGGSSTFNSSSGGSGAPAGTGGADTQLETGGSGVLSETGGSPDVSSTGGSSVLGETGGSPAAASTGGSSVLGETGGSPVVSSTGGATNVAGATSVANTGTGGAIVAIATGGSASVCTSNSFWRSGENQSMRPGEACINCHSYSSEAPAFVVAGTVYPTAREPADCNGSNSNGNATVIITDANGTAHSVTVNSVGNFMLQGAGIPLPYHAKVQVGNATRSMIAAQTSGDCNSCHTEQGANGAPGRIMLP